MKIMMFRSRRKQRAGAAEARRKAKEKHAHYDTLVEPPDAFKPTVVETYGFIDHELRGVLRTVAESHTTKSASDLGLSDGERKLLIGVTLNRMYQTLSVGVQSAVARQLRCAT